MTLLPMIDEKGAFSNGLFVDAYMFCKENHCNGKCKAFYDKIKKDGKTGFYTCPYGLTSYYDNEKKFFLTSFKNKTFFDAKKERRIANQIIEPSNPTLSGIEAIALVDSSRKYLHLEKNFKALTHEIRGLNDQNISICDDILQTYFQTDENMSLGERLSLKERIRTVYFSSHMIKQRFLLKDIDGGIDAGYDDFRSTSVHGKFLKISKFYTLKPIKGNSFKLINANSLFDFIPLLLIDNAVKYSYKHDSVDIIFNDCGDKLIVTIESYGPYCEPSEFSKITQKGYRGKNAMDFTGGSGLGLYYVKRLCDYFDIELEFDSGPVSLINEIEMATFKAILTFKRFYNI